MKTFLKNAKIETFFTILIITFMSLLPFLELIGTFFEKIFFYQEELLSK